MCLTLKNPSFAWWTVFRIPSFSIQGNYRLIVVVKLVLRDMVMLLMKSIPSRFGSMLIGFTMAQCYSFAFCSPAKSPSSWQKVKVLTTKQNAPKVILVSYLGEPLCWLVFKDN